MTASICLAFKRRATGDNGWKALINPLSYGTSLHLKLFTYCNFSSLLTNIAAYIILICQLIYQKDNKYVIS